MFKVVAQSEKIAILSVMVGNLICYELVIELQGQIGSTLLVRSPSTQFYTPVVILSQKNG